jgi:hypothetical protein
MTWTGTRRAMIPGVRREIELTSQSRSEYGLGLGTGGER